MVFRWATMLGRSSAELRIPCSCSNSNSNSSSGSSNAQPRLPAKECHAIAHSSVTKNATMRRKGRVRQHKELEGNPGAHARSERRLAVSLGASSS
jgi:hypothetical protein